MGAAPRDGASFDLKRREHRSRSGRAVRPPRARLGALAAALVAAVLVARPPRAGAEPPAARPPAPFQAGQAGRERAILALERTRREQALVRAEGTAAMLRELERARRGPAVTGGRP
jgi:hypothetical protein